MTAKQTPWMRPWGWHNWICSQSNLLHRWNKCYIVYTSGVLWIASKSLWLHDLSVHILVSKTYMLSPGQLIFWPKNLKFWLYLQLQNNSVLDVEVNPEEYSCVSLCVANDFFRPWPAFIGCLSIKKNKIKIFMHSKLWNFKIFGCSTLGMIYW